MLHNETCTEAFFLIIFVHVENLKILIKDTLCFKLEMELNNSSLEIDCSHVLHFVPKNVPTSKEFFMPLSMDKLKQHIDSKEDSDTFCLVTDIKAPSSFNTLTLAALLAYKMYKKCQKIPPTVQHLRYAANNISHLRGIVSSFLRCGFLELEFCTLVKAKNGKADSDRIIQVFEEMVKIVSSDKTLLTAEYWAKEISEMAYQVNARNLQVNEHALTIAQSMYTCATKPSSERVAQSLQEEEDRRLALLLAEMEPEVVPSRPPSDFKIREKQLLTIIERLEHEKKSWRQKFVTALDKNNEQKSLERPGSQSFYVHVEKVQKEWMNGLKTLWEQKDLSNEERLTKIQELIEETVINIEVARGICWSEMSQQVDVLVAMSKKAEAKTKEIQSQILMLEKNKEQIELDMEKMVVQGPTKKCIVCMTGTLECTAIPCGHTLFCSKCCERMSACPICRSSAKFYRVFLDV